MPVNGFSVGKDVVFNYNDANGPVTLNRIKSFSAKQKTSDKETVALDGINRHVILSMGWEGDVEFERVDSTVDDYFSILEDQYYAGQNIPIGTFTETITEATGALSQWQYQGVVLKFDDHGTWKGDDIITQKLSWMAQRRKKLA